MKKIIALALCAVMLCLCLASCGSKGDLDGEYVCYVGTLLFSTIEFDGDKVTQNYKTSGNVSTGTYKLEGDKIICQWDSGKSDTFDYDKDADEINWVDSMVWKKK